MKKLVKRTRKPVSRWQPIDIAPRDGTPILASHVDIDGNRKRVVVVYETHGAVAGWVMGRTRYDGDWRPTFCGTMPDLWQHLPALPHA